MMAPPGEAGDGSAAVRIYKGSSASRVVSTADRTARTANEGRDFLTSKVGEGRQYIEEGKRKVTDDFSSFLDRSKEAVQRQKEQLTAAFEAGKAAYREEKGFKE